MHTRNHTAVGVDGCRGGWIAAIHRPDAEIQWMLEQRIETILQQVPRDATILADMIIGLPDAGQPRRECDRLARKFLSPHGSRVFSAPPRETLAAKTYPEACQLARAATGKALSKQCWHLIPKIRELDSIADPRIRESHPEVAFARFNDGTPVAASKKSMAGQKARLRLLQKVLPAALTAYLKVDITLGTGDYLQDDCIDALALCAAAKESKALQAFDGGPGTPSIWY